MRKTITAFGLASALLLPAGLALASDDGVTLDDATRARIETMLTEQGYEVAKIKTEDGLYEAYAKKDGKRMEIFLDADLSIVRTDVDE
ncbi:Peptidase propeptide and YPEB domain-containing protein [Tranquillimonas rosea]|uniref:Peptidase propeptide and YPEB domain-containing protein n=1 Tax=Tranquillimonas rosea TaxID=641238 RepID=A0A1H9PBQ0_9RHOB|nr:PepSY domain-containing protein [Tranquillimonas rosea]SER45600.1 Peptidase propeptide and YPEB domain-containing protein [Tranquillimonas rosea]